MRCAAAAAAAAAAACGYLAVFVPGCERAHWSEAGKGAGVIGCGEEGASPTLRRQNYIRQIFAVSISCADGHNVPTRVCGRVF